MKTVLPNYLKSGKSSTLGTWHALVGVLCMSIWRILLLVITVVYSIYNVSSIIYKYQFI